MANHYSTASSPCLQFAQSEGFLGLNFLGVVCFMGHL